MWCEPSRGPGLEPPRLLAQGSPMPVPSPSRAVVRCAALMVIGLAGPSRGADRPARIEVEPASIELAGDARRQLIVTARYADGSLRDVTREARYRAEGDVAEVSPTGVVRSRKDGAGKVVVEAFGQVAEASVSARDTAHDRPASFRLDAAPVLSKAGLQHGGLPRQPQRQGRASGSASGAMTRGSTSLALTRDALGRRIDRGHPEPSLIVAQADRPRPARGRPAVRRRLARGRAPCSAGSPPARPTTAATAPQARRGCASSPSRYGSPPPGLTQQLVVTAEFADGTRRDVTRQASYDVERPDQGRGDAPTAASRRNDARRDDRRRPLPRRAGRISRLAFLADRPDFVWRDRAGRQPDRHARLRQAQGAQDQPVRARDRRRLPPPRLPRRHRPAARRPTRRGPSSTTPTPTSGPKLVDRLLARPEFADFWALKWADLLRNEEKTMGDEGRLDLPALAPRPVRRRRPARRVRPPDRHGPGLDLAESARELLPDQPRPDRPPPRRSARSSSASGSSAPAATTTRSTSGPRTTTTAWPPTSATSAARRLNNVRRDKLDKHEINGDEIVLPRRAARDGPAPHGPDDGPEAARAAPSPTLGDDPNALDDLADWLTRDNPQFARNLANRVWFHLMGRGVVDPVDDFRDSNPPSNPALLDALTGRARRRAGCGSGRWSR